MNELRTEECYSMLSKVLIEREQLKEQLEYERSVRGNDPELEKLLQHCTVDELEKLRQERDDLKKEISDLREQVSTDAAVQVGAPKRLFETTVAEITDEWASMCKTFCEDLRASGLRDEDVQLFEKKFFNIGENHKRTLDIIEYTLGIVAAAEKEDEFEAVKDIIKNHEVETRQRVENSRIAELEKQISEMQETEQRLRKQRDMFYRRILKSKHKHPNFPVFRLVYVQGLLKDYEEAYDCPCSAVVPVDDLGGDYKNLMIEMNQQLGEMNAKDEEFLRMSNLPSGPPLVD
jgi:hypothetical protein